MHELADISSSTKKSPAPRNAAGWGVPDWREANDYPAHDELDLSGWRWEFLRRRHGYRLDWLRPDDSFGVSRGRYFQDIYGIEPPANPRLSMRRILKMNEKIKRSRKALFRPHGTSYFFRFFDERLSSRYAHFNELDWIVPPRPRPSDLFIRIDLQQELRPQFAALQKLLEKNRWRPSVRKHPRRWPLYLRLLDARDAGASYAQCAAILPGSNPTPHAARDMIQAAEHLRQEWPFSRLR